MKDPTIDELTAAAKDALTTLVRGYIVGDTTATSVALIGRTDDELTVITNCLAKLWNLAQRHADASGVENSGFAQLVGAQDRAAFAPAEHREEVARAAAAVLDRAIPIDDLLTTAHPAVRVHVISTYVATLLLLADSDVDRLLHVLAGLVDQAIQTDDGDEDEPTSAEIAGAWRAFHLLDAYGNGNGPRADAVTVDADAEELRTAANVIAELNHGLRINAPLRELHGIKRAQANAMEMNGRITPERLRTAVLDVVRKALADADSFVVLTAKLPEEVRAHAIVLHTMSYGLAALGPDQFVGWLMAVEKNLEELLPDCPYTLTA